jgi:hypothetical protein
MIKNKFKYFVLLSILIKLLAQVTLGARVAQIVRLLDLATRTLINFITCGFESSAPFFVIYKAGANPRRIGDRLVRVARSNNLTI